MAKQKNPYLKKANTSHEYTTEQVLELDRCMKDPIHFITKYCRIQHPVRGAISFELYDYQRQMIKAFKNNRLNIILSARQTGKCTCSTSLVTTVDKNTISSIRRCILFLFDRVQYRKIYKDQPDV